MSLIDQTRPRRSWLQTLLRRPEPAGPPDGLAETIAQARCYEELRPLHLEAQLRVLRNLAEMLEELNSYYDSLDETDAGRGLG